MKVGDRRDGDYRWCAGGGSTTPSQHQPHSRTTPGEEKKCPGGVRMRSSFKEEAVEWNASQAPDHLCSLESVANRGRDQSRTQEILNADKKMGVVKGVSTWGQGLG